jgi:imidazolonepropionase-like amidohydrolase
MLMKLSIFAGFCAALALASEPSAIAIHNARVFTGDGAALDHATVVIRDGLIEAVGRNVAAPPDAWVIEGAGLTVYPGLIDGLSTWGVQQNAPGGPAPHARGPEDRPWTTTWISAADLVQPTDRRIEQFRSAGFTSAVVFPTRGIFAGQGSVINLAGNKPGQMVVAARVGQYVSLMSGSFASFPGSLMGVIAYIRQLELDAEHYRLIKAAYEKNPRGMQRPEYDRALDGLLASPRLLLPANRAVEISRMIAFGAELKQPFVLYGMVEAYRAASQLKAAGIPVLVNLRWPERARDADPEQVETYRVLEARDRAPSSPAALANAGVKFAFYSGGIERPRDLMRAVKRAIDAGLSYDAAVRALTLSPAEIYGVADRLGSIDKGKIANLIVVKGNLFEDGAEVKYIIIDGVKYEPVPEPPQPTPAERLPTGGEDR